MVDAGRTRRSIPRWTGIVATALLVGLAPAVAAQTSASEQQTGASSTGSTNEALGKQELQKRVVLLLSGYHFTPSREDLEGLASEKRIAETLRTIASDRSALPSLRSRAVDTLALYPSEATSDFLESLLDPPPENLSDEERRAANLLRHHAITSIAKLHDDERAVSILAELLDAEKRPIRLTAISALGKHTGRPGVDRLRTLAKQVDDQLVRDELERFVDVPPSTGN